MEVDTDPQVPLLMDTSPIRILIGNTPRLIDEWQEQPKLWNLIRHEVDKRALPAQFILTGSANPEETAKKHSGAGSLLPSICVLTLINTWVIQKPTGSICISGIISDQRVCI